jgi:hypothetical protein
MLVVVGLGAVLIRSLQELHKEQEQSAKYRSQSQQPVPLPRDSADNGNASSRSKALEDTITQLRQRVQVEQETKLAVDQQLEAARSQVLRVEREVQGLNASLRDSETRRAKAEEALSSAHLQLAKAEADASRMRRESAQTSQIARLLESASLSQLDLKPAVSTPAFARVFWQDDRGLLLVARDLPAVPQDGSFQLWFYTKGAAEPVNVGVLRLEGPGNGVLFVPPGPALSAMAGALVSQESEAQTAATPGKEILKIKP